MSRSLALGALVLLSSAPGWAADSNILPADYTGPLACRACHLDMYARWWSSAHRTMNQNATPAVVLGDFSGRTVRLEGGDVTFSRRGADHLMTLARGGQTVRRYLVTRTVGTRASQFYIGRQVDGPEPRDHPLYQEEHKLPYAYLLGARRWLPENYFDPDGPDHDATGAPLFDAFAQPRLHPWKKCVGCHNTLPYVYRLAFTDWLRRGFPLEELAFSKPAVAHELGKTLDLRRLDPHEPDIRDLLGPERHFVSLGVSCEACHLGGAAHAAGRGPLRFGPVSPLFTRPLPGAGQRTPYVINGICSQCHSARVELYPHGGARVNSREAIDLGAGACASRISCTNCHDPHVTENPPRGQDAPKHLAACTGCHPAYGDPGYARAHHGHPAQAQVSCLDCHMPRITQGLERVVRSHTISSPTNQRMLAAGSANACNLCHLDRPLTWTLAELAKRWGKQISPDATWQAHYGPGLAKPVGEVWLEGADHSLRLLAADAFARSPHAERMWPRLVRVFQDPYPVNRLFAQLALERWLGRRLSRAEIDITAPIAQRRAQVAALAEAAPVKTRHR